MKNFPLFLLLILSASTYSQNQSVRHKELINFDWKFIQKDVPEASNPQFDDSQWKTVNLPHDASISGPFVQDSLNSDRKNGFLPRLRGWYRKKLSIPDDLINKKCFLEFEGIYRDARIYVNGKLLAHQLNGFESFLVDISEVVQAENVIAVSYDNTDKESSRWYNGEGIYRDVYLVITNPVHVAYNGTFVTTPFVTEEKASVNIRTEIINELSETTEVTLKSEIFSPDGKSLGEVVNIAPLASKEVFVFQQSADISSPQLWGLENPNLYKMKSTVLRDQEVVDSHETTFGIRTVEFSREKGLLLNGKKILIEGVNIHHDLGPLGAAAFERGFERRLEGLKKLGCNGIRLSHNPHDPYILDWCDKNGMLVYDEAFDKWDDQFFGEGNHFEDHWKESLKNFIKRDRNHPSVFIWSVGNETHQQRDAKAGFGVRQLKEMVEFVHQTDPTRKVTCGLHPSRKSGAYRTENYYREGPPEMVFYMDVVSTNYREEFWPVDKANYPQLTFILSEAQVGNLGNEWFNFNHDSSVGLFYWGGTDYIGESFGWPAKGWPNGIIDWNDHWKPFSYYMQSLFSDKPMVHITTYDPESEVTKYWNEVNLRYQPMFSHWNFSKEKDSVKVFTFTNGEEVELFLNGKSLGVKKIPPVYHTKDIKAYSAEEYDPDNPINTGPEIQKELEWKIPYESGTLRAESKVNGRVVSSHELKTAGEPFKIQLIADRNTIKANGMDLSYVTVEVVDKNGITIPDADDDIRFQISGPGTLAGVGNADITTNESFANDYYKVFQGKALAIIRSTRSAGAVKIKATAKGLKSGSIEIISK